MSGRAAKRTFVGVNPVTGAVVTKPVPKPARESGRFDAESKGNGAATRPGGKPGYRHTSVSVTRAVSSKPAAVSRNQVPSGRHAVSVRVVPVDRPGLF